MFFLEMISVSNHAIGKYFANALFFLIQLQKQSSWILKWFCKTKFSENMRLVCCDSFRDVVLKTGNFTKNVCLIIVLATQLLCVFLDSDFFFETKQIEAKFRSLISFDKVS